MAGEMWGIPGGMAIAQEQGMQLAQIAAANETRALQNAQIKKEMGAEELERRTLAEIEAGPDIVDTLGKQAVALAKIGRGMSAAKLAEAATTLVYRQQATATAASQQKENENQLRAKRLSEINALISGVKFSSDPEKAFETAKMLFLSNNPDVKEIPPQFQQYSPELVDRVLNGTREGIARLAEERKAVEDRSQAALRAAQENYMRHREAYMDARLGQIQRGIERKEKNDGKPPKADRPPEVKSPIPREVQYAQGRLEHEYPDGFLTKEELALAAKDLAARAKGLVANNRGKDFEEALEEALEELRPRFKLMEDAYKVGPISFGPKKWSYKVGGHGSGPAELPSSRDPKDLKKGTIYNTQRGPAKWNGTAFEPVK